MYALHVKNSGSGIAIYEGEIAPLMVLFYALESFPADVMKLELVDDNADVLCKWLSPDWND